MKLIAAFLFPFRLLKLNVKASINERVFMYQTRLHRKTKVVQPTCKTSPGNYSTAFYRLETSAQCATYCQYAGMKHKAVQSADMWEKRSSAFQQFWLSLLQKIQNACGMNWAYWSVCRELLKRSALEYSQSCLTTCSLKRCRNLSQRSPITAVT